MLPDATTAPQVQISFANLELLDLSKNGLFEIPDLSGCPNLKVRRTHLTHSELLHRYIYDSVYYPLGLYPAESAVGSSGFAIQVILGDFV